MYCCLNDRSEHFSVTYYFKLFNTIGISNPSYKKKNAMEDPKKIEVIEFYYNLLLCHEQDIK